VVRGAVGSRLEINRFCGGKETESFLTATGGYEASPRNNITEFILENGAYSLTLSGKHDVLSMSLGGAEEGDLCYLLDASKLSGKIDRYTGSGIFL
jgi:hypothetical protein